MAKTELHPIKKLAASERLRGKRSVPSDVQKAGSEPTEITSDGRSKAEVEDLKALVSSLEGYDQDEVEEARLIYRRIERELAVEEARAERLLRLYNR